MSCRTCDEDGVVSFVRIDNANVEIIGCKDHLRELLRLLRIGMKADKELNPMTGNSDERPLDGVNIKLTLSYPEGVTRQFTVMPVDERAVVDTVKRLTENALRQMKHDKLSNTEEKK